MSQRCAQWKHSRYPGTVLAQIEVSKRCALRQQSCKPLWSDCCSKIILREIEVEKRCALPKHSCKPLCPAISNMIAMEIELDKSWTLLQHCCAEYLRQSTACLVTPVGGKVRQRQCDDAPHVCHHLELPQKNELACMPHFMPGAGGRPVNHDGQAHVLDHLFHSLRGHCEHDGPASSPSPAPVVCRNGSKSNSQRGLSGFCREGNVRGFQVRRKVAFGEHSIAVVRATCGTVGP